MEFKACYANWIAVGACSMGLIITIASGNFLLAAMNAVFIAVNTYLGLTNGGD